MWDLILVLQGVMKLVGFRTKSICRSHDELRFLSILLLPLSFHLSVNDDPIASPPLRSLVLIIDTFLVFLYITPRSESHLSHTIGDGDDEASFRLASNDRFSEQCQRI